MAKKRIIPFKALPGSWGLKGKTFERAKIEYELSGYERDVALAKIDFEGIELEKKLLEIDKKAGILSNEDFERQYKKLSCETEEEKELVDLEQDFKYNKISEKEYTKMKATLQKEPWVDILGLEFDPKNPTQGGAFNLDWNDEFIVYLRKNGYQGVTDSQVVDKWFDSLFVAIAVESGMFKDNEDGQIIRNTKLDDGLTEYS